MLRVRTFGGLAVERDDRLLGGAAGQRKSLALLALLADSGEQGLTRDRLGVLLWPDSDAAQLRNLIRQRLFHLRRDLGVPELLEGTVQIRLNPGVMSSDVAEFTRALQQGDLRGATAIYAGPFLDGFHLSDVPEFERWTAQRRDFFHDQVQKALRTLARDASLAGNSEEAVEWWRRLAILDPLDTTVAISLMQALVTAGDVGGALRHADAHSQAIRDEIGLVPPEIAELTIRLTEDARSRGVDVRNLQNPAPIQSLGESARVADTPALGGATLTDAPTDARPVRGAQARKKIVLLCTIGLAGAAATVPWLPRSNPQAGSSRPADASAIAVFPFQVRGSPSYKYLRDGVPDLINIRIDGAGALRSVDPNALSGLAQQDSIVPVNPSRGRELSRRVGAGRFVLGTVVESGGTLSLLAKLYDLEGQLVGEAQVDGGPADLAQLVDRLTRSLLARVHSAPRDRLLQTAALTTSSFPALKEYLVGEQEFRAGRHSAAADAFQRAVRIDTTFALAYYRMAVAAESAPWDDAATDSAAKQAVRYAFRLPLRDRDLFSAFLSRRRGDYAEAERRYRIVVGLYPDEVEAWYQLAEIQFHYDAFRGYPLTAAKPSYQQVLRLRPSDSDALVHLFRIAARAGDRVAIDSLKRRIQSLTPATTRSAGFVTFYGAAMRDSVTIERGLLELSGAADEFVSVTMRHVAMFTLDVDTYGRIARVLSDPKRHIWYRGTGYHSLANFHVAKGQLRLAHSALQRQPGFGPDWSLELRGLFAVLPFLPLDPAVLDTLQDALTARRAVRPMGDLGAESLFSGWDSRLVPFALGLIAVRTGDSTTALRHAERLTKLEGRPADSLLLSLLSRTIRAEVLRAAGQSSRALQILGDERPQGTLGLLGHALGSQVYQRYLRAALLQDLGQHREALKWYESLVQGSGHEIIYLAPSYLRQAEIYDRLGQVKPAIENYARFAALWNECDPALRPMVAAARSRIKALQ